MPPRKSNAQGAGGQGTTANEAITPDKLTTGDHANTLELQSGSAPAANAHPVRRCPSRDLYYLAVIFFSVFWSTTIYGGIDLFSVEMARGDGSRRQGDLPYDVALYVFMPVGLFTSAV